MQVQEEKVIPQPEQEPFKRHEDDKDKVFQVYKIINLPLEALKA